MLCVVTHCIPLHPILILAKHVLQSYAKQSSDYLISDMEAVRRAVPDDPRGLGFMQ